jgi:hypothetical protein
MVSVDFFTVPTIQLRVLYVFVILAHDLSDTFSRFCFEVTDFAVDEYWRITAWLPRRPMREVKLETLHGVTLVRGLFCCPPPGAVEYGEEIAQCQTTTSIACLHNRSG